MRWERSSTIMCVYLPGEYERSLDIGLIWGQKCLVQATPQKKLRMAQAICLFFYDWKLPEVSKIGKKQTVSMG